MKQLFLVLSFSLLLCSCSKNKVFDKYIEFKNYDWNMNQTVNFDVNIEDTSALYNIYIPVRHIENYPYDGLLLNLTYSAPSGEERTKNYKLKFRDADGKFKGKGSGDIWDEKEMIIKNNKFNSKGIYKFEIINNMPKTPTQGIMSLGLLIEKVK